jgi:hypothetical protein
VAGEYEPSDWFVWQWTCVSTASLTVSAGS